MTTQFISEFQIDTGVRLQLIKLLQSCFPETDYHGRTYFKQLPHHRLLLWESEELIGQLSIDYRIMNLNGEAVRIFGLADVCIHPAYQGRGLGAYIMNEAEKLAQHHPGNIDFLFLVTDISGFYERLGYSSTSIHLTWLKIHEHKTIGIGSEKIEDSHFMVKAIGDKVWQDGELDMLGYMY